MTPDSTIAPAPECIECDFGDGLVILNSQSNVYFRLNPVGKVVWHLLAEAPGQGGAVTLDRLVDGVVEVFDVRPERCRADVEALLRKMQENRLVRIG